MTTPPRWAVVAAYAVPLCVLPSAIWRLGPVVTGETTSPGYLVLLSGLSMVLALLTLVLVHGWGERLPRRPARLAASVATAGGALLVAICTYFLPHLRFGFVERGWSPGPAADAVPHERPGWSVLRYYVPLLAWGPLVLAVAADYRRRVFRPRSTRQ